MADIQLSEVTYLKEEIDSKISEESIRVDTALDLKQDSVTVGSPSGIATLDEIGKITTQEIPFSSVEESGDIENEDTVINPKRMHYQIGLTTIPRSEKGEALGVAPLGADKLINSVYLPASRTVQTFVLDTVLEMYNLPNITSVFEGDRVIVTKDTTPANVGEWVASTDTPLQADWTLLPNLSSVSSVNGQTGNITITSIAESISNAADISALELRVEENESDIVALEGVTSVNTSSINSIEATVATNTANISTNNTNAIQGITDNATSISELQVKSYCNYYVNPSLPLTNIYQKVTSFVPTIAPVGITEDNGTFTASISGIYHWNIERVYTNGDTNPSTPIEIYIEIRKNSVALFSRTAIISAATAADEPSIISFNSPFISEIESGDTFEFYFKSTEGINSPTDVVLTHMQMSANKIG